MQAQESSQENLTKKLIALAQLMETKDIAKV